MGRVCNKFKQNVTVFREAGDNRSRSVLPTGAGDRH
ncbi:hypothetical protein SPLC1_S200290 [Arthrospira platensis C1]|nr:hypothetical protein SPLC1_S200290 [Arthrospira platensis C1]